MPPETSPPETSPPETLPPETSPPETESSAETESSPQDLSVSQLERDDGRFVVFSWTPGKAPQRAPLPVSLTPAERAVHALLMVGLGDLEIASLRETTRSTVTKQVDAIFRKLGVRSRRELIARHSSQRP